MQVKSRSALGQLSDMDIRLLRVFKSVAECGGMAAAELDLNIGISTVSRHIKDLGFQILDVAADGRDTDVEIQLGRGHAAALGHAFEYPQQANVHIAQLAQRGTTLYLHKLPTWY